MITGGGRNPAALPLQKPDIFINCRAAQIADPRKFADVQAAFLPGWIMAIENRWNAVLRDLRPADALALSIPLRTRALIIANSN